MLARDELEECNTLQEFHVTQGGIRMLRKLIDWDQELKDDIQKKILLEESADGGRSGDGFDE